MMEVQINGKKYNFPKDVIDLEARIDRIEKAAHMRMDRINECLTDIWAASKKNEYELKVLQERVEKLEKLNI